ncbi:DUF4232 domain-containing protein [Amycolatopsis sp. PS_44_ISF1]|uniref:DUF4232 domain-containing protein n=1 Tax=Amycolatopsis sp. PS_44_ISF1 TaxID=2974917 RepID=UPI0028DD9524|nr:DUF4232 domain-containing protein [Amycolatopsis sp. PS_44_ISF1]MDT8914716.1 DUF4232 domain-containing protein [Amycolatopsis sp. PS_44_ISF1]
MLSEYRWQFVTAFTVVAAAALVSAAVLGGHREPSDRAVGTSASPADPATPREGRPRANAPTSPPASSLGPLPATPYPSVARPGPAALPGVGPEAAPGAPPPPVNCTSDDVALRVVAGGTSTGNHNAAVQLTAKPGRRCLLKGVPDLSLSGGDNVRVEDQAPANAPAVLMTGGSSAYIPLRWTTFEPDDQQQTPNGLTFAAPSEKTPRGEYVNPNTLLDWTLGPVDANPSHAGGLDIGAVTPGTAPA